MAEAIYVSCAIASIVWTTLVIYRIRRHRTRFLVWSTFCFAGLAFNNIVMPVDLVFVPELDVALVVMLLIGLQWDDS